MALMQQWEEIELAPIILIKSAEPVYGDRAVDALKARVRERDPDVNITEIDAANYAPRSLEVYTSPSLFGESRTIIVPNLEQLTADLQCELLEYLEHPEPDVVVILRYNGTTHHKKLLDALAKAHVPTVSITAVKRPADKAQAVQADVKAAGRSITTKAVNALVDALGSDVRELLVGTKQLLADVDGTIDDGHVHTYFSGRIEATGFNVADAAILGNSAKAIELARHAMSTGVPPVLIVSAMSGSVRRLMHVLGMRSSAGSIIGERTQTNLSGWKLDRAKRELRGWSADGLAAAIQAVAIADEELKGASRDPEYAVEKAIIAIARARRMR